MEGEKKVFFFIVKDTVLRAMQYVSTDILAAYSFPVSPEQRKKSIWCVDFFI